MSSVGSETPGRSSSTPTRQPVHYPGMIRPSPDSRRRVSVDHEPPVKLRSKRKAPSTEDTEDNSDSSVLIQPAQKKHQPMIDDSDSDRPVISVQPDRKKKKSSQSKKAPKAKKVVESEENISSNVTKKMLRADSDIECTGVIVKARAPRKVDTDLVKLRGYYHPPTYERGDDRSKPPLSYACCFCHKDEKDPVRVSYSNMTDALRVHRDGSTQSGRSSTGCVGRDKAKKDPDLGVPLSVAERRAAAINKDGSTLDGFVITTPGQKFDNLVFNQMACTWLIRHALPWTRVEDPILKAMVGYLRRDAKLYGRKWAATEAKRINSSLKSNVFKELKQLTSLFNLVHDGWTSKGNMHGFIGASVTYVDAQWRYHVRHLTLKVVAWHHHGPWLAEPIVNLMVKHDIFSKILCQTTNSGSNNKTMAAEMHSQFALKPVKEGIKYAWDPSTMHIFCFCHKLALIVNAGLAELGVKAPPPAKVKSAARGHFPTIGTIEEEDEGDAEDVPPEKDVDDLPDVNTPKSTDEVPLEDENEWDLADAEDEVTPAVVLEDEVLPTHRREANQVDYVLRKVDFIVRRITRLAAWRKEFERVSAKKQFTGSLIAGYGIRWNIKYESRHKAWLARSVIDQLCKEDIDWVLAVGRQPQKNGKPYGYFHQLEISTAEWDQVRRINDELEIFLVTTKRMEGDGPTGCMVIPEYVKLRHHLQQKIDHLTTTDAVYPMLAKMLMKTQQYLDEALQCETLVMATLLHPLFCLKFFHKWFDGQLGAVAMKAECTLRRLFSKYDLDSPRPSTSNKEVPPASSSNPSTSRMFHDYSDDEDETSETVDNSLENCLLMSDKMHTKDYNLADPKAALEWWSKNERSYRVLAIMARDYLATTGSLCAAERIFSAAADICPSDCGSLLARTIEALVSSRLWLREGVMLGSDFDDLSAIFKAFGVVLD